MTYQRRPLLCNEDIRAALRQALRTVRSDRPFAINAWVLLPDHLHGVWTLPPGDADFSIRWAMIKRFVSKRCGARYRAGMTTTPSPRKRQESLLWQRRFWEHTVRDEDDFRRCVDYVHWNPVKHGHVARVVDWSYSTFHRFVRNGRYPADWGGDMTIDGDGLGEPRTAGTATPRGDV